MATLEELKKVACDTIDKAAGDLNALSKAIWEKPELAFKEYRAHDLLCDFLKKQGRGLNCLGQWLVHKEGEGGGLLSPGA